MPDINVIETRTSVGSGVAQHSRVPSYSIPDLSDKIIRLSDHPAEEGDLSDVYKCQYKCDEGIKEVAVKALRFKFSLESRGNRHDKTNKMIRRELEIWMRVNHANIVPFLGITYGFGREGNASLVSLWMANGTLDTFLENYDDCLTDAHRLQLLLDISSGLSYLHSFSLDGFTPQPIVHGDLTCNNVLLDNNFTPRLIDFGLASVAGNIPEGLAYLQTIGTGPGAIRWAAPEHFLVENTERTIKSDIYSLGNLTFLVLSGKSPWSEVHQDNVVMVQLFQGHKPARPKSRPIQDAYWSLIEHCWSSPDQRPLAEDVVSSLQDFLRLYPTPQPLHACLNIHCPSMDITPALDMVPLLGTIHQQGAQSCKEQPIQDCPSASSRASIVTLKAPRGGVLSLSRGVGQTCRKSCEYHHMPTIPTSSSQLFRRKCPSQLSHPPSRVIPSLGNSNPLRKSAPVPSNRPSLHHSAFNPIRGPFFNPKSD